jgi:hypothetical protein
MCRCLRGSKGASSVPSETATQSSLLFCQNSCDPHWLQKERVIVGEEAYSRSRSAPVSSRKSVFETPPCVAKAAPCALRHIEQWQCVVPRSSELSSYCMPPQRQLPRCRGSVICSRPHQLSFNRSSTERFLRQSFRHPLASHRPIHQKTETMTFNYFCFDG